MKFVLLFGPPAVGKMSVGRELEKITGLRLFHNHMTIELVVPFFDFGLPWGGDGSISEIDSLAAIGMGLNFNAGDKFNARLDYGIPLTDIKVEENSLQENGVTFSLDYSF